MSDILAGLGALVLVAFVWAFGSNAADAWRKRRDQR